MNETKQQLIDIIKSINNEDALEYLLKFATDFTDSFCRPTNEVES